MKSLKLYLICLIFTLLIGCSPLGPQYRIIQQGNIINPEQMGQLKPGMSKVHVTNIMGTPLTSDLFNPNRWEYVYSREQFRKPLVLEKLIVKFENDQITSITFEEWVGD
ncbi:MAG: outer membrane protein assembly factor BamE [Gammaproteobacteria bacterium]